MPIGASEGDTYDSFLGSPFLGSCEFLISYEQASAKIVELTLARVACLDQKHGMLLAGLSFELC